MRAVVFCCSLSLVAACRHTPDAPKHRERASERDVECRDATKPSAYFYPAEDRHYGPDDPHRDGCVLLVADHLFCCPAAPRSTDR